MVRLNLVLLITSHQMPASSRQIAFGLKGFSNFCGIVLSYLLHSETFSEYIEAREFHAGLKRRDRVPAQMQLPTCSNDFNATKFPERSLIIQSSRTTAATPRIAALLTYVLNYQLHSLALILAWLITTHRGLATWCECGVLCNFICVGSKASGLAEQPPYV